MFAFFGKFYVLCFLERSVLKIRPFALLPTLYSIGILSLSPAPTHLQHLLITIVYVLLSGSS